MTKTVKKCSTDQRFNRTRNTTNKIGTLAKLIAYQDLSNRHKIAASAVCDIGDHNAMSHVVKAFLKAERISKENRILTTQ